MNAELTITRKFHITPSARGRRRLRSGQAPPIPVPGRVPRVARMMALAIHLDRLVQDGKVESQAELARLGHVTRARLSQIFDLLSLAPDIQDSLLSLPLIERGREPFLERQLRKIAADLDWSEQRKQWQAFNNHH